MPVAVTLDEVARAADALRAGELVAFPTETVYGLGADASSPVALARLYAVKGRPTDHPVIVHLADADALDDWAIDVPDAARRLADAFWPGPLTLVLRRAPGVLDAVTGSQDTVGLRVPDQPVALALLREFGGGVAAPSANRFGRVSPTTAADVRVDLGDDVDLILDDGPCRVGVESTIVDCAHEPFRVLRVGKVGSEELAATAGERVESAPARASDATTTDDDVRVPGALASHYAPRARVVVVDTKDNWLATAGAELGRGARVGVIVTDGRAVGGWHPRLTILGAPRDATEYAHDLYRMLRAADVQRIDVVFAQQPRDHKGLGAAVADRLRRAAAPRPSDGDDGT